jgi:hypothetical protein
MNSARKLEYANARYPKSLRGLLPFITALLFISKLRRNSDGFNSAYTINIVQNTIVYLDKNPHLKLPVDSTLRAEPVAIIAERK